jgi:hypothetical protein
MWLDAPTPAEMLRTFVDLDQAFATSLIRSDVSTRIGAMPGAARTIREREQKMRSAPESGEASRYLSTHILSASVVMIGVSTTLIGLVKVARAHMGPTRADQFAGLVALLFLFSAVTSYLSIRYADRASLSQRCECIADQVFVCALVAIAAIAVFFAYEVI